MINGRNGPKIFILSLYKLLNVMVSSASPMDLTKVMHLDPTRGLTASHAPELHYQLALTRKGSLPKIISRIVPVFRNIVQKLKVIMFSR